MTLNNEVTYNVDLNQVVISTPGPQGPQGPYAASVQYATNAASATHSTYSSSVTSASGMPTRWYGSFYDTTTQTSASINTPTPIACNTSESASTSGVRMNSSSIIFDNSGVYNIQFSAQLYETSNNVSINLWLRKNGMNVPHTNTRMSPSSQNPYLVAAWNFVVSASKNDYFQLMWATSDTSTSIIHSSSTSFCPEIPSVIITAVQV